MDYKKEYARWLQYATEKNIRAELEDREEDSD